MGDVSTLLVLGLGRGELFVAVGIVAGIVSIICIAAVLWLTLAPLASRNWATQFGTDDFGASGPDPVEVIDGRASPVPASQSGSRSESSSEHPADTSIDADIDADAETDAAPGVASEVAGSDTSA